LSFGETKEHEKDKRNRIDIVFSTEVTQLGNQMVRCGFLV